MHKNFEINQTKIKGGCQSGRKVVTHNSKSDLPLVIGSPQEHMLPVQYNEAESFIWNQAYTEIYPGKKRNTCINNSQ